MLKLRPRTRATADAERSRSRPPAEHQAASDARQPSAQAAPAKPGKLDRVGAGWKFTSGALGTIATAVGLLATFGVIGGGAGAPAPGVAIASAATKASDSGSSKVLVTVSKTPTGAAPGSGGTVMGAGEFDYRRGRGRLEYDLSRTPHHEDYYAVEVRFDGPSFFVRDSGGVFRWPEGKEWLRVRFVDLAGLRLQGGAYAKVSDLGVADPSEAVKTLESSASGAKLIGEESLHGEQAKHYRVPRGPGTTVDIWVDEKGYLRKLETTTRTRSEKVTTRTELDDFGVEVDTKLPPRNRVWDLAEGR
jgi:hypothetical protein